MIQMFIRLKIIKLSKKQSRKNKKLFNKKYYSIF